MYRFIVSGILIGLMLIGGVGCRRLMLSSGAEGASEPRMELLDYQQAVRIYREGDYKAAAQCFQTIHAGASDASIQRMALYGMACSQLMAAETFEDYRQGLQLWNQWVEDAALEAHGETPLLMVPLLKEKAFFGNLPSASAVSNELQESKIVPAWQLAKTRQEVENLKQQLDESERVKKNAQKKIAALEKEIEELKSQIKALETIDHKMQKKKSAIPSAN